jgi:MFS family permease
LQGECRLLALGLAASAAQQLSLALAGSKGAALGAVALGSLGSVAFPTVSSIKANNAGEHEQGAVQGALAGARALASGVGPLLFAFVFALTTRTDSPLPFFPGASFLLGSALMVGAVGLTLALPADAGGHAGSLFAAARRARRPLEAAEEGGGEGAESKSLLGAPSEGGSGLGKRASLDGLTTGAPLPLL